MLGALVLIVPLAVAGAVSPVMLTEQTLLLARRDGRRTGTLYAAGVVITLLVLVVAMVVLGRAFRLPTEPRLSESLDLVVGSVLLGLAALVLALGRRRQVPSTVRRTHPRVAQAALPFGVFSMATNVTTLALMVPAAKVISSAAVGFLGRAVLVAVLVSIAAVPAWGPVVLTMVAPDVGERALDALHHLITRWGRMVLVLASAGAGLFFVTRAVRLLG
ncbi:MAG: GAP family protein [Humibacillus sp.]|nr:GAP family protein [Humibacillus sp.]MDN5775457.1 GAP family protein [Humibacillus sp.]